MAYANGRLPDSILAPIAGGRLRKDAALRWNAMNYASRARYGVTLLPLGGMSTYRTYAQQVYLWNTVAHAHDTNWVAYPGTSNHGWGLAVDLASHGMRLIVDAIGAKFGYQKKWSDAPVEWWHIRWAGFGSTAHATSRHPTLRRGAKGAAVLRLQKLLRSLHLTHIVNGHFGKWTDKAVRRFQSVHGLHVDGVVGRKTWLAIERATHKK
jgi:hypothetical protein